MQTSETFPTLQQLGIPVEFNYAGVPYVSWGNLAHFMRYHGWEQEFTSKYGAARGELPQGPYAQVAEEIVRELKQRSGV